MILSSTVIVACLHVGSPDLIPCQSLFRARYQARKGGLTCPKALEGEQVELASQRTVFEIAVTENVVDQRHSYGTSIPSSVLVASSLVVVRAYNGSQAALPSCAISVIVMQSLDIAKPVESFPRQMRWEQLYSVSPILLYCDIVAPCSCSAWCLEFS